MTKKCKLPNVLYVYEEQDGDYKYYIPNTSIADVDAEDGTLVGEYHLVDLGKLSTTKCLALAK